MYRICLLPIGVRARFGGAILVPALSLDALGTAAFRSPLC
jgi:hypothetical protein